MNPHVRKFRHMQDFRQDTLKPCGIRHLHRIATDRNGRLSMNLGWSHRIFQRPTMPDTIEIQTAHRRLGVRRLTDHSNGQCVSHQMTTPATIEDCNASAARNTPLISRISISCMETRPFVRVTCCLISSSVDPWIVCRSSIRLSVRAISPIVISSTAIPVSCSPAPAGRSGSAPSDSPR